MNRDEAVWYYRLGGHTLGPVSWAEIEQLTRDTVNASELMVARGGDPGWTTAADVAAAHPELAASAAPAAPVAAQPVAADGDWNVPDAAEPEAEAPVSDIPWATPSRWARPVR